MSFDSLLRHTLVIERAYGEDGADVDADPDLDDYGQPIRTFLALATVRGLIQPASAREIAASSQAGAEVADHTIFIRPRDITTADRIRSGGKLYQLLSIKDGGGQGRHLELGAREIASTAVVVGS